MEKNLRISNFKDGLNGKYISTGELVEMIKTDKHTERTCRYLRAVQNGEDVDEGDYADNEKSKDDLAKVEFHAICNGKRERSNIQSFTGYVVLDIDNKSLNVEEWKERLKKDSELQPTLIFTSPRGGMKVVYYVSELLTNKTNCMVGVRDEYFKNVYAQVACRFYEKYGLLPDTNVCKSVQFQYLSHDKDVYYDETAYVEMNISDNLPQKYYDVWQCLKCGGSMPKKREVREQMTYDDAKYEDKVKSFIANIDFDNGRVICNDKKVFVGSVSVEESGGRKATNFDFQRNSYRGYAMKWQINIALCWLFSGDTQLAMEFREEHFEDGARQSTMGGKESTLKKLGYGEWNDITKNLYGEYTPDWEVLMWLVNTFEIKQIHNYQRSTEIVFEQDGGSKGNELTRKYDTLKQTYGIPDFFDVFVSDNTKSHTERDLRFYSALVTLSAFSSNLRVQYYGKAHPLNLYLLVVGKASSGKGQMTFPLDILTPTLDRWYDELNKLDKERYANEIERANEKKKKNKKEGIDGDEEETSEERIEKPIDLQVCVKQPTAAMIIETLASNNNNLLFFNEEFDEVANAEQSAYGGFSPMLRAIYDNRQISAETVYKKRNGYTSKVRNSAIGMLISGTPLAAKRLFPDIENGLISRFLTMPIPKSGVWKFPASRNEVEDYSSWETEFLAWHVETMLGSVVNYCISPSDEAYMKQKYTEIIPSLKKLYVSEGVTGDSIDATINRYLLYVYRVAALIQSVDEFEQRHKELKGGGWMKPEEYIWSVNYNDYINAQRVLNSGYGGFVVERELSSHWLELADILVRPLLIHHIHFLESYGDKRTEGVVDTRFTVLDKMEDEFTHKEYATEYQHYMSDGDIEPKYDSCKKWATRQLKKLEDEGYITIDENIYKKL